MIPRKIIFAGPVGAGKTTAICAVSEVPTLTTDVAAESGFDPPYPPPP